MTTGLVIAHVGFWAAGLCGCVLRECLVLLGIVRTMFAAKQQSRWQRLHG